MRNAISARPSSKLMPIQSQPRASGRQVFARPFVIEPRRAAHRDRRGRPVVSVPRRRELRPAVVVARLRRARPLAAHAARRPAAAAGACAREVEVEREVARATRACIRVARAGAATSRRCARRSSPRLASARPKPARAARWSCRSRPCADRRSPRARTAAASARSGSARFGDARTVAKERDLDAEHRVRRVAHPAGDVPPLGAERRMAAVVARETRARCPPSTAG